MMMRWCWVVVIGGCVGIGQEVGFEREEDPEVLEEVVGPTGFGLGVEATGDGYASLTESTRRLEGRAFSSVGLERVESGPADAPRVLAGLETFDVDVPLNEGANLVELRAFDVDGNRAHGNRSLLRADYLPRGAMNESAIVLGLDDATLGLLGVFVRDLIMEEVGDLGELWMPGSQLVSAAGFDVKAGRLTHHPPTVAITHEHNEAGQGYLLVHFHLPGLRASLDIDAPVVGRLEGHIEGSFSLWVGIWPSAERVDGCISGFEMGEIAVGVSGFDADLHVDTGFDPFDWLASAISNAVTDFGPVRGLLKDFVVGMIEDAVDGQAAGALSDLSLTIEEPIAIGEETVDLAMCMTEMDLDPELGSVQMGARVTSSAPASDAPGVPRLPATHDGGLAIDPALLNQIFFAAWEGGMLTMEDAAPDQEALVRGYLTSLIPQFRLGYDGVLDPAAPFQVDLVAEQAPLVTVGGSPNPGGMSVGPDSLPASEADVTVTLGDVRVTVRAGEVTILELHAHMELALALQNVEGVLTPVVVPAASRLALGTSFSGLPIPAPKMDLLHEAFASLFADQIGTLLGALELELPSFGDAPLPIGDVRPSEGGMLVIDAI